MSVESRKMVQMSLLAGQEWRKRGGEGRVGRLGGQHCRVHTSACDTAGRRGPPQHRDSAPSSALTPVVGAALDGGRARTGALTRNVHSRN